MKGYIAVPETPLTDKRLSLQARAAAAWLAGRGAGVTIKIETLKQSLGMSETEWEAIRKELEGVGWVVLDLFGFVDVETEKEDGI